MKYSSILCLTRFLKIFHTELMSEQKENHEEDLSKRGLLKIKNIIMGLAAVALAAAIAFAGYFYIQYYQTQRLLKNPALAAAQQTQALLSDIGKLIELPANETPTIATVSDVTKLQGQPFFAHAKNGDKVLIYTNAKKAILYRPSQNKIIEVAPVNIADIATPTPTPTGIAKRASPSPSPRSSR